MSVVMYHTIEGDVTELVTLAQARMQLRIDDIVDHEDTLIESYISEARQLAEDYIGRYIGERTLTIKSSDFIEEIEKFFSPINEITEIKAYDSTGTEITVPTEVYDLVQPVEAPKRIIYQSDELPDLDTSKTTPVTTVMKLGYNDATISPALVSAIKMLISWLYENRTDVAQEKQTAVHNILRAYKKWA